MSAIIEKKMQYILRNSEGRLLGKYDSLDTAILFAKDIGLTIINLDKVDGKNCKNSKERIGYMMECIKCKEEGCRVKQMIDDLVEI